MGAASTRAQHSDSQLVDRRLADPTEERSGQDAEASIGERLSIEEDGEMAAMADGVILQRSHRRVVPRDQLVRRGRLAVGEGRLSSEDDDDGGELISSEASAELLKLDDALKVRSEEEGESTLTCVESQSDRLVRRDEDSTVELESSQDRVALLHLDASVIKLGLNLLLLPQRLSELVPCVPRRDKHHPPLSWPGQPPIDRVLDHRHVEDEGEKVVRDVGSGGRRVTVDVDGGGVEGVIDKDPRFEGGRVRRGDVPARDGKLDEDGRHASHRQAVRRLELAALELVDDECVQEIEADEVVDVRLEGGGADSVVDDDDELGVGGDRLVGHACLELLDDDAKVLDVLDRILHRGDEWGDEDDEATRSLEDLERDGEEHTLAVPSRVDVDPTPLTLDQPRNRSTLSGSAELGSSVVEGRLEGDESDETGRGDDPMRGSRRARGGVEAEALDETRLHVDEGCDKRSLDSLRDGRDRSGLLLFDDGSSDADDGTKVKGGGGSGGEGVVDGRRGRGGRRRRSYAEKGLRSERDGHESVEVSRTDRSRDGAREVVRVSGVVETRRRSRVSGLLVLVRGADDLVGLLNLAVEGTVHELPLEGARRCEDVLEEELDPVAPVADANVGTKLREGGGEDLGDVVTDHLGRLASPERDGGEVSEVALTDGKVAGAGGRYSISE